MRDVVLKKLRKWSAPETLSLREGILWLMRRGIPPLNDPVEAVQDYPAGTDIEQAWQQAEPLLLIEGEKAKMNVGGVECWFRYGETTPFYITSKYCHATRNDKGRFCVEVDYGGKTVKIGDKT